MARIEGLEKVIAALRSRAAKAQRDSKASAITGYTAKYALWVHENMEIHPPGMILAGQPRPRTKAGTRQGKYWDPQGRVGPNFLLGPAREMQSELAAIVREALRQGKTMSQALLLACLRLQRESQRRVPVNTGNLKASAFTRLE